MQIKPNKSWLLLGVGALLGAGTVYAASPRYDEAVVSIDKAIGLLNNIAEEKPGAINQKARATKALERAKVRIACAKANSDSGKRGCSAAKGAKFDDNGDDEDNKPAPAPSAAPAPAPSGGKPKG
jgi:hypothetical protein